MRDLSVVVSAPGSCDRLATCLGSLAAQTLPPDRFEIVVVLHGPGHAAREAVERATRGPLAGHEVELVDAVAALSVRELGSAVAEADIVVLLQQHRGYDVDALAALATRFLDTRGTVTPSDRAERL